MFSLRTRTGAASVVLLIGTGASAAPVIGGCQVFPADNIWNVPIDTMPVDCMSDAYINGIGRDVGVHPDFGTVWKGAPIGIPYVVVPFGQPLIDVTFDYWDESDPGPYPIPPDPPIEGGLDSDGDRHILIMRQGDCMLFELFAAYPKKDGSWYAGSGAIFDLVSNDLRPDGWTSADAAGFPILPALVRFDEVMSGEITHALRFTCEFTRDEHLWPARHDASDFSNPEFPPMGQRFRLKASFDESRFSPPVQVILRALKKYGMMLADNGSNWYLTGVPDSRWDDDMLVGELWQVKGTDFEAIDVSSLMVDPDSAQVDLRKGQLVQDLNHDGDVDGVDLALLLGQWGACRPSSQEKCCAADFDGNGFVNGFDLAMLLAAWN